MQQGIIKTWKAEKYFGFVQPDDNSADVFFHGSEWRGSAPPARDIRVCYEIGEGKNGRQRAIEVTPI